MTRGRPRSPNARTALLKWRATAKESRQWRKAARLEGLTFSEWARQILNRPTTSRLEPLSAVNVQLPDVPHVGKWQWGRNGWELV